jgi:hypothetical protein
MNYSQKTKTFCLVVLCVVLASEAYSSVQDVNGATQVVIKACNVQAVKERPKSSLTFTTKIPAHKDTVATLKPDGSWATVYQGSFETSLLSQCTVTIETKDSSSRSIFNFGDLSKYPVGKGSPGNLWPGPEADSRGKYDITNELIPGGFKFVFNFYGT